ncbi:MAG: SpoIID/LytB domain-containing protein [Burkholderiales bacterium]
MKKCTRYFAFIFILVLALSAALGADTAYAAAFHTDIRVLLSIDGTKPVDFTVIGEYKLKEDPSFEFKSDKMTVSIVGNRPVLKSGDAEFTASTITLASGDYNGTSAYIRMTNSKYGVCTYLGDISFDVEEGAIRVINTLPIESYLYGVVPHEMSNTFPIESLKAQAVCARGYAVANCSKFRLRAYDILDTSADQVYHGYASKYNRAKIAVDETAGQVLTYGGDIIQAYYSASNGGQTELTGNVWKSNLPYYVQKDDIYDLVNPDSLEEKSFIPSEFNEETLPLMDALVLRKLTEGANAAAGEQVNLVSTVRVKAHTASYDPPSRMYTKADVVLMVSNASGKIGQLTVTLPLGDLVYSEENLVGIFNTGRTTLRMRGAERGALKTRSGEYEGWFLTNRRYGHGIGLSQRGAQQRATDGQAYNEILAFYYADTQLCTIGTFETAPALKSDKYSISKTGLSGITLGTAPAELLSNLASDGGMLSIISSDGSAKTSGVMATGDFVRTVYGDGTSYFDLPVVLYGDTDGNGSITKSDLDALCLHVLNITKLTGPYLEAADLSHDGKADSLDVLLLAKHIMGAYSIEQTGGKR